MFIKVQELKIFLRTKQTFEVLIFFKEKFCLMSGLKFPLPDVTSFLPDNLSGLEKDYIQVWGNHDFNGNKQMQMVFTAKEFLKVAIESWPTNFGLIFHLEKHLRTLKIQNV